MMKTIGAVIIMVACSGAGLYIAQGFKNRTNEIRQLQNILAYIETEIIYGQTRLIQIMENISSRETGVIGEVFSRLAYKMEKNQAGFPLCWQEAFDEMAGKMSLKEREKLAILRLGTQLGQTDRHNQQKYIRIALAHLQTEEQDAYHSQNKYEKLSRTLGILVGALLVIVLF